MGKKRQVASLQQEDDGRNHWKWAAIVLLLLLGVLGNDYLHRRFAGWCLLIWGVLLAGDGWLFLTTAEGQKFKTFLALAVHEIKLVVWPSQEEVVRTTMVVALMVFVASFLLWLIDLFLVKMIAYFV